MQLWLILNRRLVFKLSSAMLGPVEIQELLSKLDLKPTKKLGQNFVHDANTVRKIVKSAQLSAGDCVLEVGPGLGSLTLGLLPVVSQVIAVDIDQRLLNQLPITVKERAPEFLNRLVAIHADALELKSADLSIQPTALVANLPYNVSVPVILTLLSEFPTIKKLLVMVQAEVADRLAALPGTASYGAPSVKMQWFMDVQRLGNVPRPVFIPVPNVDSGLVLGISKAQPVTNVSREKVFKVIDAAFNQRRKMLRSALATWAGNATKSNTILENAGIDPKLRGERLSINQYVAIAEQQS